MEETLITAAKEKGFISDIIGKSVNALYSNKDFYHLWMCELQKWLREIHKIHVTPYPSFVYLEKYIFVIFINGVCVSESATFDTYEQALEAGLQVALKLIK